MDISGSLQRLTLAGALLRMVLVLVVLCVGLAVVWSAPDFRRHNAEAKAVRVYLENLVHDVSAGNASVVDSSVRVATDPLAAGGYCFAFVKMFVATTLAAVDMQERLDKTLKAATRTDPVVLSVTVRAQQVGLRVDATGGPIAAGHDPRCL